MAIILNSRKPRPRDVKIERNGRITFRCRPCATLGLQQGDSVVFCMLGSQMYLYKDNASELGLKLSGRRGQMHTCSVDTARTLLRQVRGISLNAEEISLIASTQLSQITIDGQQQQAIAVINMV